MEVTTKPFKPGCGVLEATLPGFRTVTRVGVACKTPPARLGLYDWSITAYPGGEHSSSYMSWYLTNESSADLVVDCTMSLIDNNNRDFSAQTFHNVQIDSLQNVGYSYGDATLRRNILAPSATILTNGALRLRVSIQRVQSAHIYFVRGFAPILESPCSSVVDILPADVCVCLTDQSARIPAHKYVLAVQSPVFRAMFKAPMLEAATNEVEITDFQEPVVREFVRFLYEDRCATSVLQDHAVQLLAMADKYEVTALASLCEDYLAETVSVGNALERLHVAEEYGREALKANTLSFLRTHADSMRKDGRFQEVSASTLRDIFCELTKYK
jgi:hypothetical protein